MVLHARVLLAAALALQCLLALPAATYPTASLRGAKQLEQQNMPDPVEGSSRPWFCRGLDCPEYEVVETKGHLQLRRYRRSSYLVTRVEGDSLLQAQIIGTKRLLGYLAGENEDCVKLPPTVPLNSVLITADRRSETVKGHFYFAIYLPDEVQGDAPKPKNRDVRIVNFHRRAVWVDTFDSPLLTESGVIRRGWELIKCLEDMGRKVDTRFFVFSLYEPPLPLVPHHYEIAVRARCRRHGDAPSDVPTPTPAGALGQAEVHSGEVDGEEVGGVGDDEDDYPFPEEGGGDVQDDECEDDGPDDMLELFATL